MIPSPPRLYGLADADALGGTARVPDAAEAMAEAGIRWIQLRMKSGEDRDRHAAVAETTRRLEGSTTTVWIDDRADLTALAGAPPGGDGARRGPRRGVHLGQRDLPPAAARRVVGPGVWIGLSCHDLDQVREAEADPHVDVVAYGPVFPTRSKANPDPAVDIDGVREARAATTKPLVAIGGIDPAGDPESARAVLEAGADTLAVLGALCRAENLETAARRCLEALADS